MFKEHAPVCRPMHACWFVIQRYCANRTHDADPLQWWKENESRYKSLSRAARKYLAIYTGNVGTVRTRILSRGEHLQSETRKSVTGPSGRTRISQCQSRSTVTNSLLSQVGLL